MIILHLFDYFDTDENGERMPVKPLLFHNDIEDNVEQNEFMDSSYSIHLDNFFRHAALCSTVNESEGEGEGEGRK